MILSVYGLTRLFGVDRGIDNLNLTLEAGQILGLVGRNGAGKTTAVQCMLNRLIPEKGEVKFFKNLTLQKNREAVLQRLGYVSDEPVLFAEETVGQMVDYVGSFYYRWDKDYEKSLLQEFSLDRGSRIGDLSRGMKRKLSLLLALCYRPELLILDEATSGLDADVRGTLMRILMDYVSDGTKAILYITHHLEEVEQIATDVVMLDKAKVAFECNLLELESDFKLVEPPIYARIKAKMASKSWVLADGMAVLDLRGLDGVERDNLLAGKGGLVHVSDLFLGLCGKGVGDHD